MVVPEIAAWRLIKLKRVLLDHGVIAYPTEGVWGLGCLPESEMAVQRLLSLKQRPVEKGLILVAASMEQLDPYLDSLDKQDRIKLKQCWPGPVTFLIPDNGMAPPWIIGSHSSVALRVSAHPVVKELCLAIDGPLVSTSANRANHPPALTVLQVRKYFGEMIDDLCPGKLGDYGRPSEIRDLHTNQVVRSQ